MPEDVADSDDVDWMSDQKTQWAAGGRGRPRGNNGRFVGGGDATNGGSISGGDFVGCSSGCWKNLLVAVIVLILVVCLFAWANKRHADTVASGAMEPSPMVLGSSEYETAHI